ncbi:hypothetical protein [Filimonas zeae]
MRKLFTGLASAALAA